MPTTVGSEGCFIVTLTMSLEIVGVREHVHGLPWVSYNTFQGTMIAIPFALGEVLVSLINKWRDLELALSIFSLTFAVIWCSFPESPSWLIAMGKDIKARQIMREADFKNGVMLNGNVFLGGDDSSDVEEIIQYRILDIFHKSFSRKAWLCSSAGWWQPFSTMASNSVLTRSISQTTPMLASSSWAWWRPLHPSLNPPDG